MKKIQSPKFTLNKWDWLKAAAMVFITALITGLYGSVESGSFPLTWIAWKPIVLTSAAASMAYIIKQFFSNPPK